MKKLLFLIFLVYFFTLSNAQIDTTGLTNSDSTVSIKKQKKSTSIIVYGISTIITTTGYILNNKGYYEKDMSLKRWGHLLKGVGDFGFILEPIVDQRERKSDNSQWYLVVSTYIASTALNAVGDAFFDEGKKGLGIICNVGSRGILVLSPLWIDYDGHRWIRYLLSYSSIRFSLFDYGYNLTRELPLDYCGTTAITDRIYGKFKFPNSTIVLKSLSFSIGVTIPILIDRKNYKRL